jgi:hypothetical protein
VTNGMSPIDGFGRWVVLVEREGSIGESSVISWINSIHLIKSVSKLKIVLFVDLYHQIGSIEQ